MSFVYTEAYEVLVLLPGKPQVYFTLVTPDNLPAKRSNADHHMSDSVWCDKATISHNYQ